MCDEVRSVGCAELPDGPRFHLTHQDHRITLELSVPCDLLRELVWHSDTDSDQDACSCRRPESRPQRASPPVRTEPPQDAAGGGDAGPLACREWGDPSPPAS